MNTVPSYYYFKVLLWWLLFGGKPLIPLAPSLILKAGTHHTPHAMFPFFQKDGRKTTGYRGISQIRMDDVVLKMKLYSSPFWLKWCINFRYKLGLYCDTNHLLHASGYGSCLMFPSFFRPTSRRHNMTHQIIISPP